LQISLSSSKVGLLKLKLVASAKKRGLQETALEKKNKLSLVAVSGVGHQ